MTDALSVITVNTYLKSWLWTCNTALNLPRKQACFSSLLRIASQTYFPKKWPLWLSCLHGELASNCLLLVSGSFSEEGSTFCCTENASQIHHLLPRSPRGVFLSALFPTTLTTTFLFKHVRSSTQFPPIILM